MILKGKDGPTGVELGCVGDQLGRIGRVLRAVEAVALAAEPLLGDAALHERPRSRSGT
jgi:hypothetical protein